MMKPLDHELKIEKRDRGIDTREKQVEEREKELESLVEEQRHRLEQVAGLTVDEAKRELIRGIENEAKLEAANIIKRIETFPDLHQRAVLLARLRIAGERMP